ncbi:MAG: glycosyltransferase family 2 protein [Proteobacteria bacterium]|nr:glycosyltransferase family 2 protein [Pseudomonadota bacterium]
MANSSQNAAAIVTTLRNAGAVLDSFVSYHRAIGFAHLFLIFDDPADPDLPRARAMPGVTAIAHDGALREAWRTLPSYPQYGATTGSEVMSRQLLNVEYAMSLARSRGYGWLLSIDADELFFTPDESVGEHFAAMTKTPVESVNYLNFEAVPERDGIDDFFREVDLFKPPVDLARLTPQMRQAVETVPQLRPAFFHFYNNGKAAVRLAADGLLPAGVHRFKHAMGAATALLSPRQFVLHYACCGFDTFWMKYVTLGRFADKWWGQHDIVAAIGTFHLEARNVVMQGREAALAFYRERVAMEDRNRVEELIQLGLLTCLNQPRKIIERTRRA